MELRRGDLFEHFGGRNHESVAICVAVVCQESFMREAIGEGLKETDQITVVEADHLRSLLEEDKACKAVLYIEPPKDDPGLADSIDLMASMTDHNWIVMSRSPDSPVLKRLFQLDVNLSVIPFDVSKCDLSHIVRLASNSRRVFVDHDCESVLSSEVNRIEDAELTDHQTGLLELISEGYTNKEIALIESCAESTIKMRVRSLLTKLDVKNRTHAAVIAARAGLRVTPKRQSEQMSR